jgi:hypothetical protein
VTTIVAIMAGLNRAIGVDGILLLLVLIAFPFVIGLIAVIYFRTLSWLFDLILGPFLTR